MVFMDFMGKSWRYGGITRPDIIFNIIYIMRTNVWFLKIWIYSVVIVLTHSELVQSPFHAFMLS
mgnify:CR=1 FL=1